MIDPNIIANLHNYIVINPQLAIVGERLQLKRLVRATAAMLAATTVIPALLCLSWGWRSCLRSSSCHTNHLLSRSKCHIRAPYPLVLPLTLNRAGAHGGGPCHCGDHLPSGRPLRHHRMHDHAGTLALPRHLG